MGKGEVQVFCGGSCVYSAFVSTGNQSEFSVAVCSVAQPGYREKYSARNYRCALFLCQQRLCPCIHLQGLRTIILSWFLSNSTMMWCLLSLWNVMYVMESECFDSFSVSELVNAEQIFCVHKTVHLETVCCGSQPAKSETVYCARTLTSAETDYAPEPTPP